jgi:putative ABC transport system permease protein
MPLFDDLSFTLRSLRKSPGFSLVVVFTLALAIGANVAVFSVIHLTLLKPLPYPNADRIVHLFETKTPGDEATQSDVAPANFLDWEQQTSSFESMAAGSDFHYNVTGNGAPEHVWGGAISARWFHVLGVSPELGRDFLPAEDRPAGTPVVLLSDKLWRRRYNADLQIVGQVIGLNGNSFTVVGVMPPRADVRGQDELWVPLRRQVRPDRMMWRDSRFLNVIARMKPGVTRAQANEDVNRIAASLRAAHPASEVFGGAALVPLQQWFYRNLRNMLLVSLATVALVLLVAAGNVANLMLVRVAGRSRELAVRMALGARPGVLVRQLLMEGLLLGCSAGLLGLCIGMAGKRLLLWALSWDAHELARVDLSWQVMLFVIGVSAAAGVVFALLPAFAVVRAEMHDLLGRASSANSVDVRGRRLRHGLAVAEIACSFVLLAGAGLLLRSLHNLQHVSLGFDPEDRIEVLISLPRIRYQSDADVVRFFQQVGEKAQQLPGILGATITYPVPLEGVHFGIGFKRVGADQPQGESYGAALQLVDSHTFSTLGIPLLRGRVPADTDRADSELVCLINKTMARQYWPGQDPVGHLLTMTRNDVNGEHKPWRIIGVAGDVRNHINEEPEPAVYVPFAQESFFTMELVLHTRDSAAGVHRSVAALLQSIDPDQPIREVKVVANFLSEDLIDWRQSTTLLGVLAAAATLLTAIGVFAVMAYMVRKKTREIGIRMALGASRAGVRNLILRQTAVMAVSGCFVGLAISIACTRYLGSLIYGIRPTDPGTLVVASVVISAIALLASYIPAMRAMRVDPMIALRDE